MKSGSVKDFYEIGRFIGKGGYGKIYVVYHIKSSFKFLCFYEILNRSKKSNETNIKIEAILGRFAKTLLWNNSLKADGSSKYNENLWALLGREMLLYN